MGIERNWKFSNAFAKLATRHKKDRIYVFLLSLYFCLPDWFIVDWIFVPLLEAWRHIKGYHKEVDK